MRSVAIRLLAFAVVLAACGSDEPSVLSISISSEGGTAESSLPMTVVLANNTTQTLTLVRPDVIPNFVAFRVFDADGNRMPFYGPHVRLAPLGEDGYVTLGPGQSVTELLDLGIGFQLEPGTYTISADYRNPAGGSHRGTRAVVFEPGDGPISDPIEVVVTP